MDIYPPAKQRPKLLELVEALGCRDNTLRRDECGDWRINGRFGHIYAVPGTLDRKGCEGFSIYFRGADEFDEPTTARGWLIFKEETPFTEVTQDGDKEGIVFLNRLSTPTEAEIIRTRLKIAKRIEYSEEELARRREWASTATQLKKAGTASKGPEVVE